MKNYKLSISICELFEPDEGKCIGGYTELEKLEKVFGGEMLKYREGETTLLAIASDTSLEVITKFFNTYGFRAKGNQKTDFDV